MQKSGQDEVTMPVHGRLRRAEDIFSPEGAQRVCRRVAARFGRSYVRPGGYISLRLRLATLLHLGLLTAFFSPQAAGQYGSITGSVRESATGRPLPGAHVVIVGTGVGAVTGLSGSYSIEAAPAGTQSIVPTLVGYRGDTTRVSVREGLAVRVDLVMSEVLVEIPEITVEYASVTGGAEGLMQLPGSAHYISGLELQRFAYSDVTRVLRTIPGVNLQEEDGYGLRPNIGLRGTGSERSAKITVMEDGILAAPAPYAAPAAYYFPTVGRMQAVEVRKGSSQIQYGPFTTGGAINMLSSRIPDRWSGRLTVTGGGNRDRTIHAAIGSGFVNFGFLLETFVDRSDGFKLLDSGGPTGFEREDYLAKVRVNTDPEARVFQSLVLKVGRTTENSNETYLGLTDEDFEANHLRRYSGSQEDVMESTHRHVQLAHTLRLSEGFDVTTTAYRSDFSRNWYKLDAVRAGQADESVKIDRILSAPDDHPQHYDILTGEVSQRADALDVKANNRDYFSRGLQVVTSMRTTGESDRHEVRAGVRLHQDAMDRFQWVDSYGMDGGRMILSVPGAPGTESNRVDGATAVAAFVQYNGALGRVAVRPGLRFERIDLERTDYGTNDPDRKGSDLATRSNEVRVLIPGVGIDYEVVDDVIAFAGVHRGFAPPGSSPGADAETSVSYELGGRFLDRFGRGEVVFFFTDYENLLGTDLAAAGGSGSQDLFNGGAAEVLGLELSGQYDLGVFVPGGYSVPVRFAYTFTRGVFRNSFESDFEPWGTVESGDALPYLAPHQVAWGLGIEGQRFGVDVSAKYTASMRTEAGTGPLLATGSTDPHVVIDLAGAFVVSRNVRITASVLNVTDATYVAARRPAGVRPGLPRRFKAGVQARF
jgi:Fe(3+) dicitrate transport protein